ncbi:MAG: hypothetical protein BMS9Abin26_2028 [Gammaproteobacteria bacterium]|nr:MAG: hypothetical protein BMS9Abin26_2028 [Gammaproteobacteria bacterium]
MDQLRKGESQEKSHFRAGRVFSVGIDWFFAKRGGGQEGPFDTREETQAALTMFIRDMMTQNSRIVAS